MEWSRVTLMLGSVVVVLLMMLASYRYSESAAIVTVTGISITRQDLSIGSYSTQYTALVMANITNLEHIMPITPPVTVVDTLVPRATLQFNSLDVDVFGQATTASLEALHDKWIKSTHRDLVSLANCSDAYQAMPESERSMPVRRTRACLAKRLHGFCGSNNPSLNWIPFADPCANGLIKVGNYHACHLQRQVEQARQSPGYEGCVVISVGSNNNWQFEEGIYNNTPCEIHTFDPHMKGKDAIVVPDSLKDRTHYHKFALEMTTQWRYRRMSFVDMLAQCNVSSHRPLLFMKTDCEGCEARVFSSLVYDGNGHLLPLQMTMEVHMEALGDPDKRGAEYGSVYYDLLIKEKFALYYNQIDDGGCVGGFIRYSQNSTRSGSGGR